MPGAEFEADDNSCTRWRRHLDRLARRQDAEREIVERDGDGIGFVGAQVGDEEAATQARDADAAAVARTRWQEAKGSGFAVTYWQTDEQGRWQLRLWWKPAVTLIWLGGGLIFAGAFIYAVYVTASKPVIGRLGSTMFTAFGVTFEVPIVVIVLVRFGLVTIAQLKEARPYVIVGAFVVAAIVTPPDVVSQLLLAIPLCLLYEIGILFSRFIKASPERNKATQDA